jgi:hypothetical protein
LACDDDGWAISGFPGKQISVDAVEELNFSGFNLLAKIP